MQALVKGQRAWTLSRLHLWKRVSVDGAGSTWRRDGSVTQPVFLPVRGEVATLSADAAAHGGDRGLRAPGAHGRARAERRGVFARREVNAFHSPAWRADTCVRPRGGTRSGCSSTHPTPHAPLTPNAPWSIPLPPAVPQPLAAADPLTVHEAVPLRARPVNGMAPHEPFGFGFFASASCPQHSSPALLFTAV